MYLYTCLAHNGAKAFGSFRPPTNRFFIDIKPSDWGGHFTALLWFRIPLSNANRDSPESGLFSDLSGQTGDISRGALRCTCQSVPTRKILQEKGRCHLSRAPKTHCSPPARGRASWFASSERAAQAGDTRSNG